VSLKDGYLIGGKLSLGFSQLAGEFGCDNRETNDFVMALVLGLDGKLIGKNCLPLYNVQHMVYVDSIYDGTGYITLLSAANGHIAWKVSVAKSGSDGKVLWNTSIEADGIFAAPVFTRIPGGGFVGGGLAQQLVRGRNDTFLTPWLFKLDAQGTEEWQSFLGGVKGSYATVAPSSKGVIGSAQVLGNNNDEDSLVVEIDAEGNTLWTKVIGGTGSDDIMSVEGFKDGGLVAAGSSTSHDGNLSSRGPRPGPDQINRDGWVIKFAAPAAGG
jgi:hypothetical protein